MTSSGIKRSLAVTAISALAVAGLPFLAGSAQADAYTDQISAGDALLYSLYSGQGSVQNDGTNTTIHLLAGGGSDVQQVTFQYRATPLDTWTDITTVSRSANGTFSTEWAPPTSIYNLPTVEVQAVPLGAASTPIAGGESARTGVTVGSNASAVNIDNAPGSNVATFLQPYSGESQTGRLGVISGKTSNVSASSNVDVSDLTTGSPNGTNSATVSDTATGGLKTFKGIVDFSGYNFDSTAPVVNQAVVGAQSSGTGDPGSDDEEPVTLSNQVISGATATATPSTVQQGSTSDVVVHVVDGAGAPIAGAQVFQDADNDGVHDAGETFMYTDENGDVHYDLGGSAAPGTTYAFIVNTTDGDDYEPAVDYRRTVTVTEYTPAAQSITLSSHDGSAFDFDECSAGDIKATVKDQNGNNFNAGAVQGTWTVTPYDGSDASTSAATVTNNGDGTYTFNCPSGTEGTWVLNAWQEKDGNPGESAGDFKAAPLTVDAGEANLVWADGSKAQAPAGTTATFQGTLELDNGTPLPNRNVVIDFTRTNNRNGDGSSGDNGNAVVAAQSAQPAGTTRVSDTQATAVTDANGHYAVALTDVANPTGTGNDQDELGDMLDAHVADTPAYGTNNDNSSDTLTVDFLEDSAVDQDNTQSEIFSYGMCSSALEECDTTPGPGRPAEVEINVENANGTPLTDRPVTFSTDHGFFTTHDDANGDPIWADMDSLKPAPAAAEGANYGEWEDLGTSATTTTDDDGWAYQNIAIERDPGFDDDGEVTANVTIQVGGKTFVEPVTFDSSNPLNPGQLTITLADDQDSTVLPDARTGDMDVFWDVKATDQFGNRTDEPVSLNDGTSPAQIDDTNVTSNWEGDSATETYSDVATDQTLHGTWDASTVTWTDGDTVTPGFQEETGGCWWDCTTDSVKFDNKTLTADSETIHWYDLDLANSTFTLTHTGTDPFPVGSVVQETYRALDQKGQGIDGLLVEFFRTGPDNTHTGQMDGQDETNDLGEAYYVFQGETAGTASIAASAFDDFTCDFFSCSGTHLLSGSGAQDQVVFTNQAGPVAISVVLKGHNNGAKADKVKADAPAKAKGAVVKLQKKTKSGWTTIATKTANKFGNAGFKVADKNGKRFTSYRAKYGKTAMTKKATSNTKRVR